MGAPGPDTEAVLLRATDYREADRIVVLFTQEHGKVSAIARGARSSRRRFAGALEPFGLVRVSLQRRAGGLWQLQQANLLLGFHRLLGNLSAMNEAGRALEQLRGLVPDEHPEPELFMQTVAMLRALEHAAAEAPHLLRRVRLCFAACVLKATGVTPELGRCGHCGKQPRAGQAAQLDAVHGWLVCRGCGGARYTLSGDARLLVQAMLEDELDAVADPRWDLAAVHEQVEVVVDALVRAHTP